MENKPLFDSKGNIEPWGRDFWTENNLGEFIIIFGIPLLLSVSFLIIIFVIVTFIT